MALAGFGVDIDSRELPQFIKVDNQEDAYDFQVFTQGKIHDAS